jgi:GTP-binding protein
VSDEQDEAAATVAAARKLFAGPCEFVWGSGDINSLPPQSLPEIAFVGRSNAGKSSLINALSNRKALARVSNTPGRTREINFFKLGEKLMLADLPGYGYAKASKVMAAEWQKLIFSYLRGRASLRRVSLLIDARRGVLEVDREVMGLLDEAAVSFGLVLTKIDKLTSKDVAAAVIAADTEARKHTAAYPEICTTSALRGSGLDHLKVQLAALAEH